MIISFFEEYPTQKNMQKLKLVKWPTKLYIAARSVNEFEQIKKRIKNKYVKEIVYWPILERNEGYWISPFSQRKALNKIFKELEGKNIPVMLDLELPITRNQRLLLTQLFSFMGNKKLIREFIQNYKGKVYLAEYHPQGTQKERILELMGLHYPNPNVYVIKMMYHSMHSVNEENVRREFRQGVEGFGSKFIAGLGTIATGVLGNEPVYLPEDLKRELEIAEKEGVKEVIIFRLGGLNEEYIEAIHSSSKQILSEQ